MYIKIQGHNVNS